MKCLVFRCIFRSGAQVREIANDIIYIKKIVEEHGVEVRPENWIIQ
jgi:hypothetical protein